VNRSRLIVVEGVLGAGKTSTAAFVEDRRAVELSLLHRLPHQLWCWTVRIATGGAAGARRRHLWIER